MEERDAVDQVLGTVDHALDVVHDRVIRPVAIAGRAVAFGFIIFLCVVVAVAAGLIGLSRLFTIYLFHGRVWITDATLGALTTLVGLVIWRRRRPVTKS